VEPSYATPTVDYYPDVLAPSVTDFFDHWAAAPAEVVLGNSGEASLQSLPSSTPRWVVGHRNQLHDIGGRDCLTGT